MKKIKCAYVNEIRCGFIARGETAWEAELRLFDHDAKKHKRILLNSTTEQRQRMIERMERNMQENG